MIIKKPEFEFEDERGIFKEIIRGNGWKELNFAVRHRGVNSGNHYHKKTKELFYVIEGEGKVIIENMKTGGKKSYAFKKNSVFIVEPFEKHNLMYEADTTFAILLSEPYDKKSQIFLNETQNMQKREYKKIFELEDTNWWFVGKRKVIFSFLEKFLSKKKKSGLKLLDIGCGTGIILKNFEKYGNAYGIDTSEEAINFCKKRGIKNIGKASADHIPFANNTFDLVGIFDVLYHKNIKDDEKVLTEINRVLKPGGILILTDSANMGLWSRHDIMVEARERYFRKEMTNKVSKAGFNIQKISYFNFFLFPIVFLVRKMDNIININSRPKSNIQKTNLIANFVLMHVLFMEAFLLRFFNLPFGVSILCVAKKQEKSQ